MELEGPFSSLASAVMHADQARQRLSDPARLRELGELVLEYCEQASCSVIVAASRSAEALVTAALMIGNGRVTSVQAESAPERVMIVESAVVTGNALHSTAEYLRGSGTKWIGVIVVERVRPDLDDLDHTDVFNSVAELQPV